MIIDKLSRVLSEAAGRSTSCIVEWSGASMILLASTVLILCGICACRGAGKTDSASGSRPASSAASHSGSADIPSRPPGFDGRRAYRLLERQCDFGPRYPGSTGHDEALEWLVAELSARAPSVRRQEFEYKPKWGGKVKMTNIIASFSPQLGDRAVLCAHWDTRPWADQDPDVSKRMLPIVGANDGASGVAVLLEVAGVLSRHPVAVGVDVVLFDGEDYGRSADGMEDYFAGSRHYARGISRFQRPRLAILLDMVGDADLEIYKERNSFRFAPELVDRIWSSALRAGIGAFRPELGQTVFDDHIPLNEAGIPAVNIIDFDYPYWHTLEDTPDKCRPESLKAVGDAVLGFLREE